MRFFLIILLFLAAAALWIFEGVSEHAFFAAVTEMLAHHFGHVEEATIRLGIAAALVLVGIGLAWPTRPTFLQRRPVKMFLEKDSGTDQYGIQSFPGVTYIQIAIQSTVPIIGFRAWVTQFEYRRSEYEPYAIEHNERHPLIWSKHGGADNYVANINPGEPPVRINVLVANEALQFDTLTPTNLGPRLQRKGFHLLTVHFIGERHIQFLHFKYTYLISETRHLLIEWRGPMGGPRVVWLKDN